MRSILYTLLPPNPLARGNSEERHSRLKTFLKTALLTHTVHLTGGANLPFLCLLLFIYFICIPQNPIYAKTYNENYEVVEYEEENTPVHKETLQNYLKDFCTNKGKLNAQIQNGITVDCLTSEVLWKIEYADNWANALVKAMAYPIYDNYLGEEKYAPIAGVILVQEDSDDYKNMLELRQLVEHYKLPVRLHLIENYGEIPINKNSIIPKTFKNFLLEINK